MGLMSLFCVLSVLYLVWDFATLKRLNTYLAIVDDKTRLRYTMMFGFKLMQDLAMLFWYLLRIASMFGGRR
jgi:FtsH-binding integral membrane protein